MADLNARLIAQQNRAQARMLEASPERIEIVGVAYDVPVVAQNTERDFEDGIEVKPEQINFWIPKAVHPSEPAMKTRVVWSEVPYFIFSVAQKGKLFDNWFVRCTRHRT